MSSEKKTNDEFDDILDDLGDTIDRIKPSHIDLEKNVKPASNEYMTLENEEEASDMAEEVPAKESVEENAAQTVEEAEPQEEEVRVFDGSQSASKEEELGATQVITLSEDEEASDKEAQKEAKKAAKEKAKKEKAALKEQKMKEKVQKAKAQAEEDSVESSEEDVESYHKMVRGEVWGCLKTIIYVVVVVGLSIALASYIIRAGLDFTGIGRSNMTLDITVAEGASTAEIAQTLADNDIVQDPFLFRVYCRIMGEDGTFHPGVHTVAPNMGYDGLVTELQKTEVRETISVTIPEGSTVEEIVAILDKNSVCASKDFYAAIVSVDYGVDYDFIAELTAEERANRVYLLEGYLFPDTYEFYKDGSAETVIRTMLDNFASRVDEDTRTAIKESGKTLNEVLIEASIIQMEAGNKEDMPRVARVTQNRLDNPSEFPLLQMDSTRDYLTHLMSASEDAAALDTYYNTYVREGLPVGSICNPGLDAINAALNPSEEPDIVNCYYFASVDNENNSELPIGTTEFFETFNEHEAWCTQHGVGMYG